MNLFASGWLEAGDQRGRRQEEKEVEEVWQMLKEEKKVEERAMRVRRVEEGGAGKKSKEEGGRPGLGRYSRRKEGGELEGEGVKRD